MNCPVCGAQMMRAGLETPASGGILEEWQCNACGHRETVKKEPKLM